MYGLRFKKFIVACLMPAVMAIGFPRPSYAVVPVAAVAWAVTYAAGVYRAVKFTDLAVGAVLAGIALYVDSVANKSTVSPPSPSAGYAGYVNLKPDRSPSVPSDKYANGSSKYSLVCDSAGKNCVVGANGPVDAVEPGWLCPGGDCSSFYAGNYLAQGIGGFAYRGTAKYALGAITPLYTPNAFSSGSIASSGYGLPEDSPCEISYNGSTFSNNAAPACASGDSKNLPIGASGGTLHGVYGQNVSISSSASGGISIDDASSSSSSGSKVSTGSYSSDAGGYPVSTVVVVPASSSADGSSSGDTAPFVMPCGIGGTPACSVSIADTVAVSTTSSINPASDSDRPDAVGWLQSRLPSTPIFAWAHPFTSAPCSPIAVNYSLFGKSLSYSWDLCSFVTVFQDALSYLAYALTCFRLYGLALAPRRNESA